MKEHIDKIKSPSNHLNNDAFLSNISNNSTSNTNNNSSSSSSSSSSDSSIPSSNSLENIKKKKQTHKLLEEKLYKTSLKIDEYKNKYNNKLNTINILKNGIQNIFARIGKNFLYYLFHLYFNILIFFFSYILLGNSSNSLMISSSSNEDSINNIGITENNLLYYLGLIEMRTIEILQAYSVAQGGEILLELPYSQLHKNNVTRDNRTSEGSRGNETRENISQLLVQKMNHLSSTSPLLSTASTSNNNTTTTVKSEYQNNLSDEEKEEEDNDRPLTRIELKLKTQQEFNKKGGILKIF